MISLILASASLELLFRFVFEINEEDKARSLLSCICCKAKVLLPSACLAFLLLLPPKR